MLKSNNPGGRMLRPSSSKKIDQAIGAQISAARKKLGLTTDMVAEHIGVEKYEFEKIELGELRATATVLFQLSKHLGVPVSFFYETV